MAGKQMLGLVVGGLLRLFETSKPINLNGQQAYSYQMPQSEPSHVEWLMVDDNSMMLATFNSTSLQLDLIRFKPDGLVEVVTS